MNMPNMEAVTQFISIFSHLMEFTFDIRIDI